MASHRKSAPSLPLLGQVLPPPPARLTPQIRRLDCTWWRCKSTYGEASCWRLVAGEFLGGWKRVCGGSTRLREWPSVIATNSKLPSAFCASRAGPCTRSTKTRSDPTQDARPWQGCRWLPKEPSCSCTSWNQSLPFNKPFSSDVAGEVPRVLFSQVSS